MISIKNTLFAALAALLLHACHGYEIAPITSDMQDAAASIINYQLPASGVTQTSSVAWSRLAYITDTFGPRFSGSQSLEDALDYIAALAAADGLKVTQQMTMIPKWVRGEEWATMLSPRVKKLHMVGLGMSSNSSGVNITAPVFVVSGYDDLIANCSKAVGKIVLFNTIFTTYGGTVGTRTNAAVWADECNATAALIRSIAPYSMQNPHTGYSIPVPGIPAAAVSLEDASQMQRMQDRGQDVVVSLFMDNAMHADVESRNLLIDLVGEDKPDEYVLISGHGDSWDIAEGAMDDGGGFMTSWEAVRTLKVLGLKPSRTVRAVVWVNEENGDRGGLQYLEDGEASGILPNHSIAIETDEGSFQPLGLTLSCEDDSEGGCGLAVQQLQVLSPLFDGMGGMGGQVRTGGGGADIEPICGTGIVCSGWAVLDPRLSDASTNNPCTVDANGAFSAPAFNPETQTVYDSGYFWFHHSEADTMERLDPTQVNANAAALAIWAYSIAQLPELLPRNAAAVPDADSNSNDEFLSSPTNAAYVFVPLALILLAIGAFIYSRHSTSASAAARGNKDGRTYSKQLLSQQEDVA